MTSDAERGQVAATAAEIYEQFFVPALFAEWAGPVADAAGVTSGQRVLDVACGTGVLARAALERVGASGSVVGLDANEGMLAVARAAAPAVEWRSGLAESLPFEDGSFDAVVSQFGMMFFDDRLAALREMQRVRRPGGRIAIAVWGSLDATPGYAAMVDLLQRLFGDEAASALRAPFVLGDASELRALVAEAGLPDAEIRTEIGVARFPSIESWVFTDIRGWTLADMIDEAQYEQLLGEAQRELRRFVTPSGEVEFDSPALVVTA
jgi:SAM-dependent methyltransferase